MSTYVLVHGAWGGSYGWHKLRPLLLGAGHDVYTPSLTGQGERAHLVTPLVNLSTHVRDVYNAIWYEDLNDIILVGHSYGGMVVTGVVEQMPERIKHLVYLDAFLPRDGQSLYDLSGAPPATDWLVPGPNRPGDPNSPEVKWNAARRVSHPRATLEEKVKVSVPLEQRPFSLTYIQALGRDGTNTSFFDRCAGELRGNPRWTVRTIDGGHSMQQTNPRGLFNLLQELFPS
ncbi:MAG TPA: alpha/beta hydrolase family protein [Chloroflexota bacterium]|nr:alpha/beta hydrolase family protein [Chloroflexota bacterium]